jgi:hypothetical protein
MGYVVGAYYFSEEQDADNFFIQGTISTTHFLPHLETESQAVFGQATFNASDTFRVRCGRALHRRES